jgi:hypothetical protein
LASIDGRFAAHVTCPAAVVTEFVAEAVLARAAHLAWFAVELEKKEFSRRRVFETISELPNGMEAGDSPPRLPPSANSAGCFCV